ncbi:MAG: response regulator [Candidatus Omnitrophota bacterium]
MVKLLFVDDEKGITDLLENFFRRHGFTTQSANTAEDAVESVKADRPDIVFLDIQLGYVSGLDVLKTIKEIDATIKVIMLTVVEERSTVERARNLGAEEYITKPFQVKYLGEVVVKKIQELMKDKGS